MLKLVIFDCDGVIINSEDAILQYYDNVLIGAGYQYIDREDKYLLSGVLSMADRDIMKLLANDDTIKLDKLYQSAKQVYKPNEYGNIVLSDGLKEVLDRLKRNKIKLAVLTNRGSSLPSLLQHFGVYEYFDKLITASDVTIPKPDPEGLNCILRHFKISKDEAIFIGDAEPDYYAAKAGKVQFYSYRKKNKDAHVISNFSDISDIYHNDLPL